MDARDAGGRTAVTAAAMSEHIDVVEALIDAGADVDLQDAERNNPLLLAGENGNVALLARCCAPIPISAPRTASEVPR